MLGCEVSLEEQEVRLEAFSVAAKENVDQRRFSELLCACGVRVKTSVAEAAKIEEESGGCDMEAKHVVVEASKVKEAWLRMCSDGSRPHFNEELFNGVLVAVGVEIEAKEQKRRLEKVEVCAEEELDEQRFGTLLEACGVKVEAAAAGEGSVVEWSLPSPTRMWGGSEEVMSPTMPMRGNTRSEGLTYGLNKEGTGAGAGLSSDAPQRRLAAAEEEFVPEVDPGSLLAEERVKAEGILAQFQSLPMEQKEVFKQRLDVSYNRMCVSLPSFLQSSTLVRAKWLHEEYFTLMDSVVQEWKEQRMAATAQASSGDNEGTGCLKPEIEPQSLDPEYRMEAERTLKTFSELPMEVREVLRKRVDESFAEMLSGLPASFHAGFSALRPPWLRSHHLEA